MASEVILNEAQKSSIDRTKQNSVKRTNLLEWKDLLEWQKDNEYVISGYRRASFSFQRCLMSIISIHNETINIWSHFLGTLFFAVAPFYFYSIYGSQFNSFGPSDTIPVAIYFFGVVVCFVCSTFFHVFLNHSKEIWRFGHQLDHLGIVGVIWSSAIPSVYFGFYCNSSIRLFYSALASLTAIGCGVVTMRPKFRTPTFRNTRSIMYCCLGISAFIPVVHGIVSNGWEVTNRRMSLSYFVGLALLNFTGAAIYTARVPERWYPRMFDIYGSSHQIMHVLVVCGALSYMMGLIEALKYWQFSNSDPAKACNIQNP